MPAARFGRPWAFKLSAGPRLSGISTPSGSS